MIRLALKRASTSRPYGQWQDEDYDVLADSKVIGRILGSRFDPPELRWHWSITAIVPAMPGVTNGIASDWPKSSLFMRLASPVDEASVVT